jgi:CHAT domain-containing protein/tetratricopeptide (TPR) repeat protein
MFGDIIAKLFNFEKAYVKLAEKYTSRDEFVRHAEKAFRFVPKDRKGDAFLHMGITLHDKSYINPAIYSLTHASKLFLQYDNREGESESYIYLGASNHTLGNYSKAIEYQEKALEIKKEIGDREGESNCYGNLSNAYLMTGEYVKALESQERSLKISKEIGNRNGEATSYTNLGSVYNALGDDIRAIEFLEKALEIVKQMESKKGESVCYVNLGRSYNQLGNYSKAIEYQEKALEIKKEIGDREGESVSYGNLGAVYSNLGDHSKAIEQYEKELKLAKDIGNKYVESQAYGTLSRAHLSLATSEGSRTDIDEMCQKAINYLEKALEIAKESGEKKGESECYVNLGRVHNFLGATNESLVDYRKAIEYLEKALEIKKEIGEKQGQIECYRNLGFVYHLSGDQSKAIETLEMAFNLANEIDNMPLQHLINSTLGMIHYKNNKPEIAFGYLNRAIELGEVIWGRVVEEEHKIVYFSEYAADEFDLVILTCLKLGDEKKAFEYVERSKSRAFLKILATSEIRRDFQGMTNELKALLTEEEKGLFKLRELQARHLQGTNTHVELGQMDYILNRLDQIYDNLEKIDPEYVSLRRARPLSLANIQNILSQKKTAVLIEYFIAEDKIIIFVVSSRELHLKTVQITTTKLAQYIQSFEKEVVDFYKRGYIGNAWLELSEYLIDPVSEYISEAELIYFVPYGVLHYVPLHGLELKNEPVIRNHSVTYSPSASLMQFYKSKGSGKLNTCACFGVISGQEEYTFLQETKGVANLFNTKPLINATKKVVQKNVDNDILHFACHGEFNKYEPLSSGIKLYDGKLTAREILQFKLSSDLVTLSACETGINERKPGDELIGLTRSLLYAGSSSVIVSLWPVYDPSTCDLMLAFYKQLKIGKDKATALQQAQINIMQKEQYSHPYFWAPFILVGNWK